MNLESETQWSDVSLEVRMTLIVVSTGPRFSALRIWTHFFEVFEQKNSVSWSANEYVPRGTLHGPGSFLAMGWVIRYSSENAFICTGNFSAEACTEIITSQIGDHLVFMLASGTSTRGKPRIIWQFTASPLNTFP